MTLIPNFSSFGNLISYHHWTKMTSYRLLWTTSFPWHVAALKIFSMVEEHIEDIMHNIGELLVGKSVYITNNEMENKAQYDTDYGDRDKKNIFHLQEFAFNMEIFTFQDY